jgi:hypothetical protein
MKWADRRVPAGWRRPGVSAAHRWMLEHLENSDGLGAIFPPMIYTIIALRCLGYEPGSPLERWALGQLEDLLIEEDGRVRVQPCVLAGLGHGDRHDRPGRCPDPRLPSGPAPLGPLAAGQGGSHPRRLAEATARARADGLALPVPQ